MPFLEGWGGRGGGFLFLCVMQKCIACIHGLYPSFCFICWQFFAQSLYRRSSVHQLMACSLRVGCCCCWILFSCVEIYWLYLIIYVPKLTPCYCSVHSDTCLWSKWWGTYLYYISIYLYPMCGLFSVVILLCARSSCNVWLKCNDVLCLLTTYRNPFKLSTTEPDKHVSRMEY